VDCLGQCLHRQLVRDSQRQFADHLPSVRRHSRVFDRYAAGRSIYDIETPNTALLHRQFARKRMRPKFLLGSAKTDNIRDTRMTQ